MQRMHLFLMCLVICVVCQCREQPPWLYNPSCPSPSQAGVTGWPLAENAPAVAACLRITWSETQDGPTQGIITEPAILAGSGEIRRADGSYLTIASPTPLREKWTRFALVVFKEPVPSTDPITFCKDRVKQPDYTCTTQNACHFVLTFFPENQAGSRSFSLPNGQRCFYTQGSVTEVVAPDGAKETTQDAAITDNTPTEPPTEPGTQSELTEPGPEPRPEPTPPEPDTATPEGPTDNGWVKQISGGTNTINNGQQVAVDTQGNVYLVATYIGQVTLGAKTYNSPDATTPAGFLVKYSPEGKVEWSKHYSSPDGINSMTVGVDGMGQVYVAGPFQKKVDIGTNTFNASNIQDSFFSLWTGTGSYRVVQTSRPGTASTGSFQIKDLTVTPSGVVYAVGECQGSIRMGQVSLTVASRQVCVLYRNTKGDWTWGRLTDFSQSSNASALTTDNAGDVYIVGTFSGQGTLANKGLTSKGATDIFMAKLNSSGSWLWSQQAGGQEAEGASDILVVNNTLYVTGNYSGRFGPMPFASNGKKDLVVLTASTASGVLGVAAHAGSSGDDFAQGLAYDGKNVYVAGELTGPTDFDSTKLTPQGRAVFIATLTAPGQWGTAKVTTGSGSAYKVHMAPNTSQGRLVLTGTFSSQVAFDKRNLVAQVADIFLWATTPP